MVQASEIEKNILKFIVSMFSGKNIIIDPTRPGASIRNGWCFYYAEMEADMGFISSLFRGRDASASCVSCKSRIEGSWFLIGFVIYP